MESVPVNCRNCGKKTMSDKFVLDPYFRMMVCPNCVASRRNPKVEKPVEKKPVGWDADDEIIEKAYRLKQQKV
ncbi:hypothetical protein JW968_00180 [Candidatus Woesearchaeota archaeon]|nr:hypothetical protein [Candidatus Woesearchaeota archaeon]